MQNFIICMKWGNRYGPEYVNRLERMTRRHCHIPYRFVCFTDDPLGISSSVETLPLPHCRLPNRPSTEAWRKLSLFQSEIGFSGTCLFLDLDVVVVDSLQPLFEYPGEFCIIHNWTHSTRNTGNSSVMRFRTGVYHEVYEEFANDPDRITQQFANEQSYLSDKINAGVGLTWWPVEWCKSFKKHCIARGVTRLFRQPILPDRCRIVVFHGRPNPPEAASRWVYRSEKLWRLPKLSRPASWIQEHWR